MPRGPYWTAAEDARLRSLAARGLTDIKIGKRLGRSFQAIRERRRLLHLPGLGRQTYPRAGAPLLLVIGTRHDGERLCYLSTQDWGAAMTEMRALAAHLEDVSSVAVERAGEAGALLRVECNRRAKACR